MAEKMRVHILAKALNVASKEIIAKCNAEGLQVTNHMSTLSAGLEATIREWFSEGQHATTIETAGRVDLTKVKKAPVRKRAAKHADDESRATADADTAVATIEMEAPAAEVVAESADESAVDVAPTVDGGSATVEAPTPPVDVEPDESLADSEVDVVAPVIAPEAPSVEGDAERQDDACPSVDEPPAAAAEVTLADTDAAPPARVLGGAVVPQPQPGAPREKISPAGPQNVPQPVQLKGPRVVRYEPVEQQIGPPPRRRIPAASSGSGPPPPMAPEADGRRRGRGRVAGGESARKDRGARRPVGDQADRNKEWRNRDLAERQERISDATGRRIHTRRAVEGAGRGGRSSPAPAKTEATVQAPIMIKDLCAATGISMIQMLPILRNEFSVAGNINMELTEEMAEFVALEHGVTLTVVAAMTALDELQEEFANREHKTLRSRPPVVTFLGHVDHGKTSLLDAVRQTDVTKSEDGGITQHIGAYHLEHKTAGKVTFVDTPGHAAFTAMRSRGAHLTDVAVLIVAADDGVMPQTVEAINHIKAAEVPIVVALNKIDLGTQNLNQIYGQLAEHGLQPSGDWGGDTDVIHTSAITGQGVDGLIEHLTALGDVLDLKADPKCDAMGTVIEAERKEGVGAVVRVLVQEGTLRTGSIVVCGNAFGKVRALLDDKGRRLKEAGASVPAEVWGLDEVPVAGDKFYQVKSLQRAKTVAEDARRRRVREGRSQSQRVRTLEDVVKRRDAGDIPELNIIIKADVDGSVDALRSMLSQIPSDEVKLSIRHAGVGAVNDSDVLLADASDAIIVAFRVLPGPAVKRLAEEKGVDVRHYKVIYQAGEDIKKALEGLLAPDERIETRGSCEVREVFNISKVGNIAGCIVTDGVVQRGHLLRLVRNGVVVRDNSKVGSLRRFKDDVKEVRSGMECGIRFEGFDDVKSGDVIQAIEIVKTARTL